MFILVYCHDYGYGLSDNGDINFFVLVVSIVVVVVVVSRHTISAGCIVLVGCASFDSSSFALIEMWAKTKLN